MEREILKKLLLSSMDRCNTIEILFDMEGVAYSTIRPSWSFEFSESGGVGAVEAGKVVERHGPCPGKGMPVRSTALSLPTAESSRYQGDGLAWPSRWRSEKRFREGLPGAIHPMHGRSTWVASFNGQSRNCPTWRAASVSCRGGR